MNEERLWELFKLDLSGSVKNRVHSAYKILKEYDKELAFLRAKELAEQDPGSLMVEDLELPLRVLNCLRAEEIRTVDHLCMWTEQSLARIPNLGQKGVRYIVDEMARQGRQLARR